MADEYIVRSPYPDVALPEDISLPQLVLAKAKTYKDRAAYIDDETGVVVMYTEFVWDCYTLAAGLYHHGLNKGDVVAVASENSLEYPVIFLAVNLCGAVVAGIHPANDDGSIKQMLDNCNPRYVFTKPAYVSRIEHIAQDCPAFQEMFIIGDVEENSHTTYLDLVNNDHELPLVAINSRTDPSVITYTSGTTGVKKGVVLPHWSLMGPCLYMESVPEMSFYEFGKDVALMVRPMTHNYAQVCFIALGPYFGVTGIITHDESMEAIFKAIDKYKVTFFPFTPLPMSQWTKSGDREKYDVTSVCRSLVAGAPLSPAVQRHFNDVFDVPYFKQGFGMSESPVSHVTPYGYDRNGRSVGVLLPGMVAKVVDLDTQKAVGPDVRGELWIKTPLGLLYYLKMPKETKETITPDGFIRTGDIAYYDEDGYFYIVDRLKEIICYDCFKIPPAEIESVLLDHPDIAEVGIVGYPDDEYGELPRAYIVRKPGSTLTEDDIHALLVGKVPEYMQLYGGVVFRDELPKTSIAKVMRKVLKQQMMDEYEQNKKLNGSKD